MDNLNQDCEIFSLQDNLTSKTDGDETENWETFLGISPPMNTLVESQYVDLFSV